MKASKVVLIGSNSTRKAVILKMELMPLKTAPTDALMWLRLLLSWYSTSCHKAKKVIKGPVVENM